MSLFGMLRNIQASPQYPHFHLQLHAGLLEHPLLHLVHQGEHIGAGGPAPVDDKARVLLGHLGPAHGEAFQPALLDEGGGEVTVNITVNRNGKVVSASMKESSTNSSCINDMAILAARNSRFNVDDTGSDKQSGTITYIFVPQ